MKKVRWARSAVSMVHTRNSYKNLFTKPEKESVSIRTGFTGSG
jgi:hypothetical protein